MARSCRRAESCSWVRRCNGSRAAQNLARLPFGKKIMGQGVHEELLHERVSAVGTGQRELGVIAGSVGIGLGRLVGAHGAPSDGTIFVEETRLAGHVGALGAADQSHGSAVLVEVARANRCVPERRASFIR